MRQFHKTRGSYGPESLTCILVHDKMMYWTVAKEKSFKDISIFSYGGHVFQPS